ncbi:MAG: hemerythrin domain-containing protein [Steroidobacteraceae bacterium]
MSLIDRVVAAVTPPESEEKRAAARAKARAAAGENDWLAMILQQHVRIEAAFDAVRRAQDANGRLAAQRELALILTGHSNAEEVVIYPALVRFGHKSHGMTGYTEHAGAKANMGELEYLDPMSRDFLDKLEHIRGAVAHHMYEEESARFLDLTKLSPAEQGRLTERYSEEFDRYMGGALNPADAPSASLRSPGFDERGRQSRTDTH